MMFSQYGLRPLHAVPPLSKAVVRVPRPPQVTMNAYVIKLATFPPVVPDSERHMP